MSKYVRFSNGFTVSELMVTIGVGAILMGIAIPALLSWLPTVRLNDAARQVALDLQNARMTAISQNLPFGLSFTGATAYVIFQDINNDGAYNAPGELVRGPVTLPQGITATAAATVVFQPRGIAGAVTIPLANASGGAQNVQVSLAGRVTVDPQT